MAGLYDTTTISKERSSRTYKDLNLSFISNPATKDIVKLKDVEAVKRSVRNLVELNHFEKPFHPEIGSKLKSMLFENFGPQTELSLRQEILNVINNYEPRVRVVSIIVESKPDMNTYGVTITYYIANNATPQSTELLLERLR